MNLGLKNALGAGDVAFGLGKGFAKSFGTGLECRFGTVMVVGTSQNIDVKRALERHRERLKKVSDVFARPSPHHLSFQLQVN